MPRDELDERANIIYCDWAPSFVWFGAVVLWFWNQLGLGMIALAHILDIILIFTGLSMMCTYLFRQCASRYNGQAVIPMAIIAVPTAMLVLSMLLMSAYEPASAWDALHFWLAAAAQFSDKVLAVPIQSESQVFWWGSRHPPFPSIRYASLGYAASLLPSSTQILPVGVLSVVISVITITYLTVRFLHCAGNLLIPILALYAIFSSPLYVNHLVLYGYGEAWMSIWILALVFSLSDMLRGRIGIINALMTTVSFLFCASVKSTGIYYAAFILCSFLCLLGVKAGLFSISFVWKFLLSSGVIVLAISALLFYTTEQLLTVSVAGSTLPLAAQNGFEVLKNNLYAFMNNASFGVLILALFSASFNVGESNTPRLHDAFIPVCLVSISYVLVGLQLFDPYSFGHSYRGSDTGGSRFFIPLVPLAILHVAKSVSRWLSEFPMKPSES